MELLTTPRFHSMRYTRFVYFQNLAVFNLLYTLNEETRGSLSGITFVGVITILAADDASALGFVTVAQFHLFTNRNRCCGRIDASYVIRRSNTAATIYVGVHTVCLTL